MIIIRNAQVINRGKRVTTDVAIGDNGRIACVAPVIDNFPQDAQEIDARGLWLLPGAIDTHVHFREPGLTRKGAIESESRQAVMGGVTSFMDMPNTVPQTTTPQALAQKMRIASKKSAANYTFFMGATVHNVDELISYDYSQVPGVKLFMGASTGDMAVHDASVLRKLLGHVKCPVVVHAEDDAVLSEARARLVKEYPDGVPVAMHAQMRPSQACIAATDRAIGVARETGGHLHIAHLSTAQEAQMVARELNVTADTCPQYLLFCDEDYARLGSRIKCNPSIKSADDRDALRAAVVSGDIPVIDTDHAPHLLVEKEGDALTAASGMPGVRFSLLLMLSQKWITPEQVVERMCHAPAEIYGIEHRGFVEEGYWADLVLIDPNKPMEITDEMINAPCGWTPYSGMKTTCSVVMTLVNGNVVYHSAMSDGEIPSSGQPLQFKVG